MEIFKNLDFLGTRPTLFIEAKESFKTILGGTISIMFTFYIIIGSSYFINLLLSRRTFTV